VDLGPLDQGVGLMATKPDPRTWSTGDTVRAEHLNKDIQASYAFLLNRPAVHVSSTTGHVIGGGGGSTTTLTWNVEDINTDGMFTSSSNTRLTCQTSGLYEVILHVDWEALSSSASTTRWASINYSTSGGIPSAIAIDMFRPADNDTAAPQTNHVTCIKFMDVGDYLTASATNTDSTSLDTIPTIGGIQQGYLTFFSAYWVGAS
jgi:hypothetical protein